MNRGEWRITCDPIIAHSSAFPVSLSDLLLDLNKVPTAMIPFYSISPSPGSHPSQDSKHLSLAL